jgi:hypothetical protein
MSGSCLLCCFIQAGHQHIKQKKSLDQPSAGPKRLCATNPDPLNTTPLDKPVKSEE